MKSQLRAHAGGGLRPLVVAYCTGVLIVAAAAARVSGGVEPDAKASVKKLLNETSKRAAALREEGKPADAAGAYEAAFADAVARLGADTDAGRVLGAALSSAKKVPSDDARAGRLELGAREAVVALDFKPVVEAPLPEGFPATGAVGEVVVKQYPAYRAARTPMAGGGRNSAFFTLFNHIQKRDIPMTAPVEMTYAPAEPGDEELGARTMAFLYRSPEVGRPGTEEDVEVVDVPAMTVVSVAVRGPYTDDRMNKETARLRKWLDQHRNEYAADGPPRYLGYNSPMVLPWLQYGEIQIPIRPADKPEPAR